MVKDAKIDEMLPLLIKGGFYHAGQVCVSVQRVFVHNSLVADVAERLSELAQKLKVGDPLNQNTEVGPLIRTAEVDRIESWVNEAKEMGGQIAEKEYQIVVLHQLLFLILRSILKYLPRKYLVLLFAFTHIPIDKKQ